MEKAVISYNEIVAIEYEKGLRNYEGDPGTMTLLKKLRNSFEEAFVLRISKRLMIFVYVDSLYELEQFLYRDGIHKANLRFYNTKLAAKHLFEVASGLQPVLFWEFDIVGQIKNHLQLAENAEAVGPFISGLIKDSINCGSTVRKRTTNINSDTGYLFGGMNLIYNGSQYFTMVYLIGGPGTVEEGLPSILKDNQVNKLYIASHEYEKAQEIARQYGAATVEIHDLKSKYPDLEVVFFCSGVEKWFEEFYKQNGTEENNDHSALIDYSIIGNISKIEAFIDNPWTANTQDSIDYNQLLDLLEDYQIKFKQQKADYILNDYWKKLKEFEAEEIERVLLKMNGNTEEFRSLISEYSERLLKRISQDQFSHIRQLVEKNLENGEVLEVINKVLNEPYPPIEKS